jgi:hypothetical protein
MYKLIRLLLIAAILLAGYCVAVLAILFPWMWIALGIGALYGLARRGIRYTAYGTARWADASDLEGMLDSDGLIIGRLEERR